MKRIFIYLFISTLALGFATSCEDDGPTNQSIFDNKVERNEFDEWLLTNYVYPYNIELKYRMEDIEADAEYDLVPAKLENSKILAKLIKHLWLEPYDNLAEGNQNFNRAYIPKVIHLIGSPGYNPNNTMVLGTAESGLKITLYAVNDMQLDYEFLADRYFHTMHHEYAHVFNQQKEYDPNFKKISEGQYVYGNWSGEENRGKGPSLGFITDYARYNTDEDFVELYSVYLMSSEAQWNKMLADAGEPGAKIINRKLEIVKDYMIDAWGVDMDKMRNDLQRRGGEIAEILNEN